VASEIVVGQGAAGLAAALSAEEAARAAGTAVRMTVVDKAPEAEAGGNTRWSPSNTRGDRRIALSSARSIAMAKKTAFRVKRIYEAPAPDDGFRVLVDRLWPRGISKANAHVDLWLKDVAPSDDLRRGVHSGKMTWSAFTKAYSRELKDEPAKSALASLRAHRGRVTLLYAARDEEHNNAVALKALLEKAKKS